MSVQDQGHRPGDPRGDSQWQQFPVPLRVELSHPGRCAPQGRPQPLPPTDTLLVPPAETPLASARPQPRGAHAAFSGSAALGAAPEKPAGDGVREAGKTAPAAGSEPWGPGRGCAGREGRRLAAGSVVRRRCEKEAC